MILISAMLMAQAPPAKNWVDRGEYELVAEQLAKATDPNKKLELLNQWKEKYPKTEFSWERLGQYLVTYQQLGKAKEMFGVAKEMSAADPKNFTGPYYILLLVQSMGSTDPAVLEEGEKTANMMLSNLDAFFGADKKPANVAEDAWKKQKDDAQLKSMQVLLQIAQAKKDNTLIEQRITELLKVTPKNAVLSYQLGAAILGQKKAERQAGALWHFARACGLEGEGAAPAAQKQQMCDYFGRVYPQYRGDKKGMDELKAKAAATVFPPADFAIKTKQQEDIENLVKLEQENPQLAKWVLLKQALQAADGAAYFEGQKGALLPKFKGKIVSMEPNPNPKKIVVGISDASNPEVTIEMEEKEFMPGKMEVGEEIEFEGVAKSYTADPFMLTVTGDKERIYGWTGKPTPGATKKAAPKGVVKKKK